MGTEEECVANDDLLRETHHHHEVSDTSHGLVVRVDEVECGTAKDADRFQWRLTVAENQGANVHGLEC